MGALRERLFDTWPEKLFFSYYSTVFSIRELETNTVLKYVFGATLLSHLVTFSTWKGSVATTVSSFESGTHLCWPYFQSCGEWLFLKTLPEGYSQPTLYMALYALLLLSAYYMYRSEWELAHLALAPSYVWHTLVTFVITQELTGNYDYYLFVFSTILLVLPHKEFFLKLSVVLLYMLSTVVKIHDAWVVGSYFSSLQSGLPWFPGWSIPLFTNLVIAFEMVGAWFLLSTSPIRQRVFFVFFVFFHLYSGVLVGYRYPTIVLPTLIILFGPMYRHTPIPLTRRSVASWTFIFLICIAQFLPKFVHGDEKLTLEGNMYGLYMFESNHQCVSSTRVTYSDGTEEPFVDESISARARCDPYRYWFRIRTLCERDTSIREIAWTFDHSINGNAFLRIVDEKDACQLQYRPLRHNPWIKTEMENPEPVGYPVKNIYL
jgi:hypothetical protein